MRGWPVSVTRTHARQDRFGPAGCVGRGYASGLEMVPGNPTRSPLRVVGNHAGALPPSWLTPRVALPTRGRPGLSPVHFRSVQRKGDSMKEIAVERILDRPQHVLAGLVEESTAQGAGSLRRIVADWLSGANRFDGPGEGLFVALCDGRVVGVCGLQADSSRPDRAVGRLRDIYVSTTHRRASVGRALAAHVIGEAEKWFNALVLRADTPGAEAFFTALGFEPTPALPGSTHQLDLRKSGAVR